jgi:hypothetical protein
LGLDLDKFVALHLDGRSKDYMVEFIGKHKKGDKVKVMIFKEHLKKMGPISEDAALAFKDRCHVSENNYRQLHGLLKNYQCLPNTNRVYRVCQKFWNFTIGNVFRFVGFFMGAVLCGTRIDVKPVVELMMHYLDETGCLPSGSELEIKVTLDGRSCGGKTTIVVALIPIIRKKGQHSPKNVFSVILMDGKVTVIAYCISYYF